MIITVGNTKGGVGKSTIAVNMAVASADIGKKKTLIVDGDIQGTAMDFRGFRPSELPSVQVVSITTPTIHEDIKNFSSFDNIFIDIGGRHGQVFRSSLIACDLFLIPVTPSPYDLWALKDTLEAVSEVRIMKELKVKLVLNMVIPNTNFSKEVDPILEEFKKEYKIEVCDTRIGNRQDFKKAANEGKGVIEFSPKSKADLEIRNLYQEVL